jgi:hypothetical protein
MGSLPFWRLDAKRGKVLFALVGAQAFIHLFRLCPIYVELCLCCLPYVVVELYVMVELHLCHG